MRYSQCFEVSSRAAASLDAEWASSAGRGRPLRIVSRAHRPARLSYRAGVRSIIRHPASGAADRLAGWLVDRGTSVVNAGDGTHEHPTQALLDAATLRERLGALEGRRIADPMLIGCATAASLFPYVGTIVYLIVRPPEYLDDIRERELEMQAAEARLAEVGYHLCPYCDYEVEKDYLRCPSCMRKLKDPCRTCGRPSSIYSSVTGSTVVVCETR